MITLTMTHDEATALLNLINIAVQAKGLEAAEAGAHLAKMLRAAAAEVQSPPAIDVVAEAEVTKKRRKNGAESHS